MSGGGNKVVKGRMGSCIVSDVNPNQLEAMEKTLEKETKAAEVNKLQLVVKILETFSLTEAQTLSPRSCAFDSPYPLIKVASDTKPYSKLQPTTLNGGEERGVYFINDMYYWRRLFVRRAAF